MNLLQEIQKTIIERQDLGPVLLKFRVLAARLNSKVLQDWVRYEAEGYPSDSEVPPYRVVEVAYRGIFINPVGASTGDVPISRSLIRDVANETWLVRRMRQSIAVISDLAGESKESGGTMRIEAADLAPRLHGRVYENFACHDIYGIIAGTSLAGIIDAVRSRLLELVLELETSIPSASEIGFETTVVQSDSDEEKATKIFRHVVLGNVTNIAVTGSAAQVNISIAERDEGSVVAYLKEAGIVEEDAEELVEIMAGEEPGSRQEPFGPRAKKWLADNVKRAADGTWKVGVSTAVRVITEAALKFYGLGAKPDGIP